MASNSIVRLTVEDSSFNAKIKAAAKAFSDFGARVTSAGVDAFKSFATGANTAKVAFQGFNTVLKANALVLVSTLAIQAGAALAEMVGDWISGANDAEDAQRRLNEELERTEYLIKEIDHQAKFNERIARAAGASTTEILQQRKKDAELQLDMASSQLASVARNKYATPEENEKAKKMVEAAQERLRKAIEDLEVDATAQQHHTGEYAIRGGGGGSSRNYKEFDISKIAFNPKSDESFKFNPEEHAVASGLRPEDILGPSSEWENYKDTITGAIGSIGESMNNLSFDNFHESYEKVNNDIEGLINAAKQQKMAMGLASQAVSNLGAAFQNMDDPGAKAAGTVMQAIASLALGFAQASVTARLLGPFGWVAWLAAGTAALATTISTVHNLTGYAQGGIVDGNSYSGDNIPIMANAGEVVLTRAMASNLASSLQDNGMQNMNIAGRIKGTDIILAIDRSLKIEGKQLLTWGR